MRKLIIILSFLSSSFLAISAQEAFKINDSQYLLLRFPAQIKYADFGSLDLLADKCKLDNILKLKSAIPSFPETNATVVTADGKFYSFELSYLASLPKLAVDMEEKCSDGLSKIQEEQILYVSNLKTTHVIFADKIVDILVGSDQIIADYASDINNIVRIRAVEPDFLESSVSIITASGKVYAFRVVYDKSPEQLSLNLNPQTPDSVTTAVFSQAVMNVFQANKYGLEVIKLKPMFTSKGCLQHKMAFSLAGIYVKDELMLFQLELENKSDMNYKIDFIKFYIRDKKTSKKIAMQEEELYPLFPHYSPSNTLVIEGGKIKKAVFFFSQFSLPKKRKLYIEVFEQNGGRHLQFSVDNTSILKAKQL